MARQILTISFFFFYIFSFGQSKESDLAKIKTVSQAETYIANNPKSECTIFSIESSSDTTEIDKPIYNKKVGFTFYIDKVLFKILELDSTLSFRANYIYLDGNKYSKNEIDSLLKEIISKYKSGTSFFDLVQQYNMDGNPNGDTKWFKENMMVKNFEQAVKNHKKGEIFTVDTCTFLKRLDNFEG